MWAMPVHGASGTGEVVAASAGNCSDAHYRLADDAGLGTEERNAETEDTAVTAVSQ